MATEVMRFHDNEEKLPNGIEIHRQIMFSDLCTEQDWEEPWIASIRVGPWYYCQRGDCKQNAIDKLFAYMRKQKEQKEQFEEQLQRDTERLETLTKFLESQ